MVTQSKPCQTLANRLWDRLFPKFPTFCSRIGPPRLKGSLGPPPMGCGAEGYPSMMQPDLPISLSHDLEASVDFHMARGKAREIPCNCPFNISQVDSREHHLQQPSKEKVCLECLLSTLRWYDLDIENPWFPVMKIIYKWWVVYIYVSSLDA